MSDIGQITVSLVAKIDELKSGMDQAVSTVKDSTNSIKDALDGLGSGAQSMSGMLEAALSGGVFLEYEEIAKQALEAIQQAFEMTIGKAEEFGLSNAKFAKIIGVSATEATGLAEALRGVGVASETYETLALRLGQRIGTQETAFKHLGIATRDSSNELLGGKAAMDAVFAAMAANPANENAIAYEAFGRQAKAAFDIMRASQGDVDNLNNIMHEMGVTTKDTSGEAAALEDSLNQERVAWDSVFTAIGQHVMPAMQQLLTSMGTSGIQVLKGFQDALVTLIDVFATIAVSISIAAQYVVMNFRIMADAAVGAYHIISEAATEDWGDIQKNWKEMTDHMAADSANGVAAITAQYAGLQKFITSMDITPGGNEAEKPGAYGTDSKVQGIDPKANKPGGAEAGRARQLADEELRAAEQEAQAELKIDEDKNASLLALGQESAAAFAEQETALVNRKYQIEADYLTRKAAADAGDKNKHQKDLDDLALLETKHQGDVLKIQEQEALREQQIRQQKVQQANSEDSARLTSAMAELDQEYRLHLISAEQKAAAERQLTVAILTEEDRRLAAEMVGLDKDSIAYQNLAKQKLAIEQKLSADLRKINDDLVTQEQSKWQTLADSIRSSFNGALQGMLNGTTTWRQAMGQIATGVADAFLQMGLKILEDQAQTWLTNIIMGKASATANAVGQIPPLAAVAAAAAFASTAAIPLVGPALAPEAAALAFQTVMSMEALAFASQGAQLETDRLVFAHKDELILPAAISGGLVQMIQGGGAGSPGAPQQQSGDHYTFEIKSLSTQDGARFIRDNADAIVATIVRKKRDLSPALTGGG